MEGWNDFFMLAGATAGTLIGLIFVVIILGAEQGIDGDEARTRLFITPILVNFTSILIVALLTVAPISAPLRAIALGIVGCAGLGYVMNLALTSRRRTDTEGLELSWTVLLPIAAYALLATAAAAWALQASFANMIGAAGCVLLLITAIRNSWVVTLVIARRDN
ncbi:MAG: hypothetical protein ACXWJN_04465 [Methyloceanibacter sp.]